MPNDAFTQQALATDPTFRQRVKASLTRISYQVLEESTGTAGHAARAAYARATLANIDAALNTLIGSFVFRTNVFTPATTLAFDGRGGVVVQTAATDAAMDSQLATDWSNLAGA